MTDKQVSQLNHVRTRAVGGSAVAMSTAPDVTCAPELGILQGCSLSERLLDTKYASENLFKWEHLINIALIFLFILAARWTYQLKLFVFYGKSLGFTFKDGFKKQLTEEDNKALSLSFAGYLFAVGLILWSSLTDLTDDQLLNIGYIFEWQAIGVLLLEVARLVNDKLLLSARNVGDGSGFNNNMELLKRHNVAVGAAECGMVIMASTSGPPGVWWQDIVGSLVWFVLGQLAFITFGHIINLPFITKFNFFAEIQKKNTAAGVLFGLELVAVGNLISNSILKSDSLVTFGVWFLIGAAMLVLFRFLIDLLIIPQESLNNEIAKDRNIGAAVLVGGIPVGLSFVINTFLPDTCLNNT